MASKPHTKVFGAREYIQVDAQKLISLRGAKGLTQDELSRAAGIRRNSLYNIEAGNTMSTSSKVIWALCDALGCRFSDITNLYFYEDPAHGRPAVPVRFGSNSMINPAVLRVGKKYLIDREKLILEAKAPGYKVIHYIFRQPSGGWLISYTSRDFYAGDVSVQPL
mgnify:FL=1